MLKFYFLFLLLIQFFSFFSVSLVAQEKQNNASVSFSVKPQVKQEGEKTKISFTLSKASDVEVLILNKEQNRVCHLAAGVVGGLTPPPPPLQSGLSQTLYWDGNDDSGKKAQGAPFSVRVRLGITPTFDGFLLDNPVATGRVTSMAVGPKGEVYLWHRDNTTNENQGSNKLKIMSRDAKYLKTLMPFPSNLSPEKLAAFGSYIDNEGHPNPRITNMQNLSTYNEGKGNRGRPMSDYCVPAVDINGRAYWVLGNRLVAIDIDGSTPYSTFFGEPLLDDAPFLRGGPVLCCSADGKKVYLTGVSKADDVWGKNPKNLPYVYAVNTTSRKAEIFLGDMTEAAGKASFINPRGLAIANGLLYVSDADAGRVAVFSERDKKFVGEIKINNPQTIGVDPSNGAIYVCVYTEKGKADLVKWSGYENGKEMSRITLPATFESGTHRIAVDATSKPVKIYLPTLKWKTGEIYCYEDNGEKIIEKGDPRDLKTPWVAGPRDLIVDRQREELYVKYGLQRYYRIDVKTGKILLDINLSGTVGNQDSYGTQLVPSPDGNLITLSWGQGVGIRRHDYNFKPVNWEGKNTNIINYCGIMTFMQRYLAIPKSEELYIILPPAYKTGKDQEGGGDLTSLNVLGLDGNTKRTVIWQCTAGAVPKVDRKGNIYLAEMIKPVDRSYPEFFDDKIGKMFKHEGRDIGSQIFSIDNDLKTKFWTSNIYGSIIKFSPKGGVIWFDKELPASVEGVMPAELANSSKTTFSRHLGYNFLPVDVQGAEWVRFGFSPYSVSRGAGFCMCEGVGFDVDDFGRIFYPNLGQFRIEMVDNNNNWIGTFGKYGNQDSGGENALVKKPEIPLAWPTYVAVCGDYAFVNDTISNRVIKVKFNAKSEEVVEIK